MPFCEEIRGKGLLIGCALKEEYKGSAAKFLRAAQARGLLVLIAGPDVIRMAPSLLIPDADIDAGLVILEEAVRNVVDS